MAKSPKRKVVITCAVTGSIHTPSMSPHIPITAEEIADAAIGAAEAGAAVVHLHARDPKDGRPDQSPEAFAPFLKVIKQRSPRGREHHDRGCRHHDHRAAREAGGDLQARGRFPQHGHDEFRPLPDARALHRVQARLGAAVSGRLPRAHLQEHLRRYRVHPDDLRRERHALRDRVLRHRPSLYAAPFRRSRHRQAALLRAVGVRDSRRHRCAPGRRHDDEAYGRPAVRR